MTGSGGLIEGLEPEAFRRMRRLAWAGAGLATVVFAVFVFVFSRYGGGFVDGLSGRVGEVVAARAIALADSGQPEAAAEVYAEALQAQFDDSQQRVWCYRRYGEVLMSLQRWTEAAEAFEGALAMNGRDWPSHRRLCETLRKQGLEGAVREAAERWKKAAAGVDEREVESAEKYLN